LSEVRTKYEVPEIRDPYTLHRIFHNRTAELRFQHIMAALSHFFQSRVPAGGKFVTPPLPTRQCNKKYQSVSCLPVTFYLYGACNLKKTGDRTIDHAAYGRRSITIGLG